MAVLIKYVRRVIGFLLLLSGVQFFFVGEAQAYIDPGTGAFVLQFLVAGILGAAFAVKMYWNRLKGFVRGRFSARNPAKGDQQE